MFVLIGHKTMHVILKLFALMVRYASTKFNLYNINMTKVQSIFNGLRKIKMFIIYIYTMYIIHTHTVKPVYIKISFYDYMVYITTCTIFISRSHQKVKKFD